MGAGEPGASRVRVGVTGHRALADEVAVGGLVDAALATIPGPGIVVTSLAEGADRLVARRALARAGWRVEAILPLAPDDYATDFADDASRADFRALLDAAARTSVVAVAAAGDRSREAAYLAAGIAVVDRADALLAIWDGAPARGTGGTAEIVAEARRRGLPVAWIRVDRTDTAAGGDAPTLTEERWPWTP